MIDFKSEIERLILREIEEQPQTVSDVPFEPCGCWLCNQETEDGE